MPFVNNLDLAVFPMMSKRHSCLLQEYSNGVAPCDEIWQAALSVYRELPSSDIARGFVLAMRVARKVVKNKGDNHFLKANDHHLDVRKDYHDTQTGVKPNVKDNK